MTKNYNQRKRKMEHVELEHIQDGNSHHHDHKVFHELHLKTRLSLISAFLVISYHSINNVTMKS